MNWLRKLFGMKPRTTGAPGTLEPRPPRYEYRSLDQTARVRGQAEEAERRRRRRLEAEDDSGAVANALMFSALLSDSSPGVVATPEPDSSGSGFDGFDGGASGGGGASGSWESGGSDSSSSDSGSSYDSGSSFDSGGGSDFTP